MIKNVSGMMWHVMMNSGLCHKESKALETMLKKIMKMICKRGTVMMMMNRVDTMTTESKVTRDKTDRYLITLITSRSD